MNQERMLRLTRSVASKTVVIAVRQRCDASCAALQSSASDIPSSRVVALIDCFDIRAAKVAWL
jgi:hypothetical protein